MHRCAMLGEPAHGAQDFNLLHAIGAADGDPLAFEQFGIGWRIEEEVMELAEGTGEGDMNCWARAKAALGAEAGLWGLFMGRSWLLRIAQSVSGIVRAVQ
jgi:hypothetical protein